MKIPTKAPLAVAAVKAIHDGDVATLKLLLVDHPELATVALGDDAMARTLLHVVTDWPGALWNACHGGQLAVAQYLVDRGADVNWVGRDDLTALDVAERAKAGDVVSWLRGMRGDCG